MTAPLEVQANTSGTAINIRGRADNTNALRFYANDGTTQQAYIGADDVNIDILSTGGRPLRFFSNSLLQYQINPLGVFNWYDGAGGTRMTLNATGLGVGTSPAYKFQVRTTSDGVCQFMQRGGGTNNPYFRVLFTDATATTTIDANSGAGNQILTLATGGSDRVIMNSSGTGGIATGNLVRTTCGKGIDFSAT
ncbi:MAG: hypothetical protein ACK55Z_19110, partial [bacterium]